MLSKKEALLLFPPCLISCFTRLVVKNFDGGTSIVRHVEIVAEVEKEAPGTKWKPEECLPHIPLFFTSGWKILPVMELGKEGYIFVQQTNNILGWDEQRKPPGDAKWVDMGF
jgi:hypothetical protein